MSHKTYIFTLINAQKNNLFWDLQNLFWSYFYILLKESYPQLSFFFHISNIIKILNVNNFC